MPPPEATPLSLAIQVEEMGDILNDISQDNVTVDKSDASLSSSNESIV